MHNWRKQHTGRIRWARGKVGGKRDKERTAPSYDVSEMSLGYVLLFVTTMMNLLMYKTIQN